MDCGRRQLCRCPNPLPSREEQAAIDSRVHALGEGAAAAQGTTLAELNRAFTEAMHLQQANRDAEQEEPDMFLRQMDAAIFASLDSAEADALRRSCPHSRPSSASHTADVAPLDLSDLHLDDDDWEPSSDTRSAGGRREAARDCTATGHRTDE
eukprot:4772178-Prymnesium_polylepis.1